MTERVDCSRISGPRMGANSPWPRWKVARGVPIGCTAPGAHACYRLVPTPVRPVCHRCRLSAVRGWAPPVVVVVEDRVVGVTQVASRGWKGR
jgi:hypothetical protein